ncbi:MAG: asparagine synthase-related protein [Candidatus Caldarchaeales archaeon]
MSLEPSLFYLFIGRERKLEEELSRVYERLRLFRLKDYREVVIEWGDGLNLYLASSPTSCMMVEDKKVFYIDCYPIELSNLFQNILFNSSVKVFSMVLDNLDGFFSGFIIDKDRVLFFRDHVGAIPIILKIDDRCLTSSSFSSVIGGGEHIPPGRIVEWKDNSLKVYRWYNRKLSFKDYIRDLSDILPHSTSKYILEDSTIAFSGGLDSILLAYSALKIGRKFTCITVGTPDSVDLEWAEEAASMLGIKLKKITLNRSLVEELVNFLSPHLLKPSLMDLSLASIFYIVALNSLGDLVVSGQGADELFGGYYKYLKMASQKGLRYVEGCMMRDLLMLHKTNIERDYLACTLAGKRFITPYLSRHLYDLATSIPIESKLIEEGKIIRKLVLKKVARSMGVPEKLVERPKKAAQYSSGVLKLLRRIS